MLNEKMFSLAWFWFIYVFVSNLISFMFTLYDTMIPGTRIHFIRDLYRKSLSKSVIDEKLFRKFTRDFLMQDGVLILEIIYRNGLCVVATKVVNNLLVNYAKIQRDQEAKKATLPLNSSEV
jgi:hypothetical protein